MASRSPAHYTAKATEAEQWAAAARSERLIESWRRVAETYRWLAYQQAAFGKWQPTELPAEGRAT